MPEGPRRRSPPLSRAERRALIDDGVAIHTDPRRSFTPDEQAAILRAADTLDGRRKVLRAQIAAEEAAAREAADRRVERRSRWRFWLLLGPCLLAALAAHDWTMRAVFQPWAAALLYEIGAVVWFTAAVGLAIRFSRVR